MKNGESIWFLILGIPAIIAFAYVLIKVLLPKWNALFPVSDEDVENLFKMLSTPEPEPEPIEGDSLEERIKQLKEKNK